jgi:hypothetical protein
MPIHSRWITVGVATGLLALIGASLLHAQQQPQQRRDTLQTGAVTQADTALKAKPGLQTGPAMGDTLRPTRQDTTPAPPENVNKAAPGTQTGRRAADSGKAKWKKPRTGADSIRAGRDSTHQ